MSIFIVTFFLWEAQEYTNFGGMNFYFIFLAFFLFIEKISLFLVEYIYIFKKKNFYFGQWSGWGDQKDCPTSNFPPPS
jgi:hypothetical protein